MAFFLLYPGKSGAYKKKRLMFSCGRLRPKNYFFGFFQRQSQINFFMSSLSNAIYCTLWHYKATTSYLPSNGRSNHRIVYVKLVNPARSYDHEVPTGIGLRAVLDSTVLGQRCLFANRSDIFRGVYCFSQFHLPQVISIKIHKKMRAGQRKF